MKTNQSDYATEHFHNPATEQLMRNHEEIVFAILSTSKPDEMTLKEIACRFNDWTGYSVPDSSLCSPLNILKAKGKVTDTGSKRACRVNGIRKKVWAVADNEQKRAADHTHTFDESAPESASRGREAEDDPEQD
jgi:hypothetical protein